MPPPTDATTRSHTPRRVIIRLAVVIGVAVGAAHLVIAPATNPSALDDAARPPDAWEEWRDDDFRAHAAALDRSDPRAVADRALAAMHEGRYRDFLAYSSARLQQRHTPDRLERRIGRTALVAPDLTRALSEAAVDGDTAHVRVLFDTTDRRWVQSLVLARERGGAWGVERIEGGDRGAPPHLADDPGIARDDPLVVVREFLDALAAYDIIGAYRRISLDAQTGFGVPRFTEAALHVFPAAGDNERWLPEIETTSGDAATVIVRRKDLSPHARVELRRTGDEWRIENYTPFVQQIRPTAATTATTERP